MNIGPMHLLKINRVVKSSFIKIIFEDKSMLAVTNLHAFKLKNGTLKTPLELIKGDEIWIDLYAFSADSSFRYGIPRKLNF